MCQETPDDGGFPHPLLPGHQYSHGSSLLSGNSLSLIDNTRKSDKIRNFLFYDGCLLCWLSGHHLAFWYDIFGNTLVLFVLENTVIVCQGGRFYIVTSSCNTFLIGVFILSTFPIIKTYQRCRSIQLILLSPGDQRIQTIKEKARAKKVYIKIWRRETPATTGSTLLAHNE